MITQFELKLNPITIQLPETHLIISKDDYDHLTKQATQGRYMTLNDVLEMLSVSRPWLLENVLYKTNIRSQIDIDQNPKGFVKYPKNKGGKYLFLASKTKAFFEQNFSELLKET
jgi:phage pi2 protein 07